MGRSLKPVVLAYSGQFSMELLTVSGFCGDSNVWGTPGHSYGEVTKTRRFDLFWQVFYGFTHSFGGSAMICTFGEPRGVLTGRSPKLAVLTYSG
jgi:hypothetical protein